MTSPRLAQVEHDPHECAPGDNRCYAFAYGLAGAQATCTTKGRCKVGWVVRDTGRQAWDVWVEPATGLVKVIPQAKA